jgi:hypothetical protein
MRVPSSCAGCYASLKSNWVRQRLSSTVRLLVRLRYGATKVAPLQSSDFSSRLFKPPRRFFGTYGPSLRKNKILAAKHRYNGIQRGGPVLFRGLLVVACSFDIQTYREAFLRTGQVDHRRTNDAVEQCIGMFQRSSVPGEAVQHLLL